MNTCMDCGTSICAAAQRCRSCATKACWRSGKFDSEKTQAARSEAIKARWRRGDFDGMFQSKEHRAKLSRSRKRLWQEGVYGSAGHREKMRQYAKKRWETGDLGSEAVCARRTAGVRKAAQREEWRAKVSANTHRAWQRGCYDGVFRRNPTSLEQVIADALEALAIEYYTQYRIPGGSRPFDFYIPSAHLLLEVDGDFWHHSQWAIEHGRRGADQRKTEAGLTCGYNVVRLSESEINRLGAEVLLQDRVLVLDAKMT